MSSVGGLTPKSVQHFTTPQHGTVSKSAYALKGPASQAPHTGPVKSMRVLGKENEDLQQHIRELSETLKNMQEGKSTLLANHEVLIFPRCCDQSR